MSLPRLLNSASSPCTVPKALSSSRVASPASHGRIAAPSETALDVVGIPSCSSSCLPAVASKPSGSVTSMDRHQQQQRRLRAIDGTSSWRQVPFAATNASFSALLSGAGRSNVISRVPLRQESTDATAIAIWPMSPRLVPDVLQVFPSVQQQDLLRLTAFTVSFKTRHEMTAWSSDIRHEREAITHMYMNCMSVVMEGISALSETGWINYVDPSSGVPMASEDSNQVLEETHPLHNYLGFRVEQIGCCKALFHKAFGFRVMATVGFCTFSPDTLLPLLRSAFKACSTDKRQRDV